MFQFYNIFFLLLVMISSFVSSSTRSRAARGSTSTDERSNRLLVRNAKQAAAQNIPAIQPPHRSPRPSLLAKAPLGVVALVNSCLDCKDLVPGDRIRYRTFGGGVYLCLYAVGNQDYWDLGQTSVSLHDRRKGIPGPNSAKWKLASVEQQTTGRMVGKANNSLEMLLIDPLLMPRNKLGGLTFENITALADMENANYHVLGSLFSGSSFKFGGVQVPFPGADMMDPMLGACFTFSLPLGRRHHQVYGGFQYRSFCGRTNEEPVERKHVIAEMKMKGDLGRRKIALEIALSKIEQACSEVTPAQWDDEEHAAVVVIQLTQQSLDEEVKPSKQEGDVIKGLFDECQKSGDVLLNMRGKGDFSLAASPREKQAIAVAAGNTTFNTARKYNRTKGKKARGMGRFRWEKKEEIALIGMYGKYRRDQNAGRSSKFAAKRHGFNSTFACAELKRKFKHCRDVGPNLDRAVIHAKLDRLKKQGKIDGR